MGNAAKKTNEAPKTIGSVQLDKIDRKALVKFAKQLKCGTDKDTTEALITALQARFAKLPKNRLADCTECGGESDTELEACPFCGAENEDEEDESESASESASSDESESASPDAAASSASIDEASASIDDDPGTVAAMAKMSDKVTTSATIAGANENTLAQYTESDLNEAVERVRGLKGDSMASHWRLGQEIKSIFTKQLWKQRNDAENLPAYKSFNQFVMAELGFSVQNAYWLMDVATNFTEKQVREFGVSKLGAVLVAPKEDRPRLLEAAKAGASVREIRQEARTAQEKAGTAGKERETGRRPEPRKKGARAKPAKKATAKKGTITVAKILGKTNVDLFKGPWPRTGKPEKHAMKLGDNPVGQRVLENGVTEHFTISTTSSGRLILRIDTRRES